MPKIGVSGPWVARYRNINGAVSYTDGIKLARMTSFEATPDDSDDDNNFYSDNEISETARGGARSGEITESVDNFTQEGSRFLLGIVEETIMVEGESVRELVFDDNAKPDYVGHGIIIKKRKNGKDLWRAVVYTKVMFSIPADAAETQGETIEWQAEELGATYTPDDSPRRAWKREATFESEAMATAYIRTVLNIAPIGTLTVTSTEGTEIGYTSIHVTPAAIYGNTYLYIVAPEANAPELNQLIGEGYTEWNGTDEIMAATGMRILVVEVDKDSRAQKAGIATIAARDE